MNKYIHISCGLTYITQSIEHMSIDIFSKNISITYICKYEKQTNMINIYHNNTCSKSLDSLALLTEKGFAINVIEYLENPPTAEELKVILTKLNMTPFELIRKGESVYIDNYSNKNFSDDEWIEIMVKNPVLIERPIIINGDKAVIGRPLEKVLKIL